METIGILFLIFFITFVPVVIIVLMHNKQVDWASFYKLEGRRGLFCLEGHTEPNPAAVFAQSSPPRLVLFRFEVVEVERAITNGIPMSCLEYGPGVGGEPYLIKSARKNFLSRWVLSSEVRWLEIEEKVDGR